MQECGICFGESAVGIGCPREHMFCLSCLQSYVMTHFDDNDNEDIPIECPSCLAGAKVVHSQIAPECMFYIFDRPKCDTYNVFQSTAIRNSELLAKSQLFKCPGQLRRACNTKAVIYDKTDRTKIACNGCKRISCMLCLKQYHYRLTCLQARESAVFYDAYIMKRQGRLNSEVLSTLIADEKFKAERCRLCPKCQFPIEKTDGCNLMRCGRDTDFNNQEKRLIEYRGKFGCNTSFDWKDAKPYVPIDPKWSMFVVEDPSILNYDNQIACYRCKKNIIGLLFVCINCPSLELCVDCERVFENTLHIIPTHDPHTFDIIMAGKTRMCTTNKK